MSLEDQTKVSKPLQRTEGHLSFLFYFGTKWMTWSKKCLGKVNSAAVYRTFSIMWWQENGCVDRKQWINSCQALRTNQVQQLSIQTNFRVCYPGCLDCFQVIALKLWIRRTVQTVFDGLGEKKGGREAEKPWCSEKNTSCVSNGPEEDQRATVSLTPWKTLLWGLGLFLTSCYFPGLLYSFPDYFFFLCLLQQMLSHPDSLDDLYTDTA